MSCLDIKVAIIGHYASGMSAADGQTVKTRTMAELLADICGKEHVAVVDTHNWSHRPLSLVLRCKSVAKDSDVLIMLPAHNGVRVFGPMVLFLSRLYGCRAVYSVVGGWLPSLLERKPCLAKCLRSFNDILVESKVMSEQLSKLGFRNVDIFLNYKKLPRISFDELPVPNDRPYRLVYFARIEKSKGIEDVIWAVVEANRLLGGRYSLDIYGRVEDGYDKEFRSIISRSNDSLVSYMGCVEPSKSLEAFTGAIALLFPTHYLTEGIPGTIIDAFCSGTPVIAARWQSWDEMISEGENGLTYELGNKRALLDILLEDNLPQRLISMRANVLKAAEKYRYESGLKAVNKLLEGRDCK